MPERWIPQTATGNSRRSNGAAVAEVGMSGGSKLKKDRDARITRQSSFLKQRDNFFQFRSENAGRRKDCISIHITNALHTFVVCT